MYLENEVPNISKEINSNNYLLNCYKYLTKIKGIHFLLILIELLLNIFQELETYIRGYKLDNISYNQNLYLLSPIINCFVKMPIIIKLIVVIVYFILFDGIYFFLRIKKIKINLIYISILVNILELFIYRAFMLIFFNLFFTLKKEFLIIGIIILIPHIYLIMNNFIYNHLYYFVPEFIDYPYDEFSSIFDLILFLIKIFISISGTTNNNSLGKFCFIIVFCCQIVFSLYFIYTLRNQSYLFMKNSFLNITKICFFFSKTIIIFIGLLLGKDEIQNVLFLIICICIILIIISYIYFIYNPFSHIIIKREAPMENTFFYLYILSEKNDLDFVFENKIKAHFEKCGICDLCQKYIKFTNGKRNNANNEKKNIIIDEEKEKFINKENSQNNDNNKNKLNKLFDVIYDNENKYFQFIKKVIIDYKKKGKEYFCKNSHYFVNLCFLIYSDYQKKNITLSLNERIILEEINEENTSFLENHETQISQIFLSNQFILFSNKILSELKDILNSEANLNRAKKLINLSSLLKKLRNPIYKKNLFSHKTENTNSKHLLLICSIIYEEIFNTSLNSSQIPIRDNIQQLEDIFHNNSYKINKIISLLVNLTNKSCIIIRAGKGINSFINCNLFDLFPLAYKQYQINLFMTSILENFENHTYEHLENNIKAKGKNSKIIKQHSKAGLNNVNNNKNKIDFVELKLIICQNIESKIFYKLLHLKLKPLFNNNIPYYVLFDGIYHIQRNTIITLQDLEKNKNSKEKLVAVSEPQLEKNNETYSIPFKKYYEWQISKGYIISKISSFNISEKLYNIYIVEKKDKDNNQKKYERRITHIKFEEDEEEFQTSIYQNVKKIELIEENASVSSQNTGSTNSAGISNLVVRNKKKENIYEYGGFKKIKIINYFAILIAIIIVIIEYIVFIIFEKNNYNNNISLFQYTEFSKLYFQLFSSILSLVCFGKDENCVSIVDNFISKSNQNSFDYQSLVESTNLYLAHQIMEKRNYLVNIHKRIGNQKYNELFGKRIKYSRIIQKIIDNKNYYKITSVNMKFSEAILHVCNSFQVLAKKSDDYLVLLSGKDDPFFYLNNEVGGNIYLSDYQREVYEMILNYKIYSKEFNKVNEQLQDIIDSKTKFLKIFAYIDITFDTSILLCIGTLMYTYTIFFEIILIKIINYINMKMNMKNDDFNFCEIFSKKIDNLETILQFYDSDPIMAVQNLNSIYSKYQKFLTQKNKNKASVKKKKNYKEIIDENKKNELDDIPKNQRILTRKDIKNLNITFIYEFIYFFNFAIILAIYILLLILWINYFKDKNKLFVLNQKNIKLESSLYRAINSYHLMMFHNLTISEVTPFVISNSTNANKPNSLLLDFYENLKFSFNSKKEKKSLGKIYQDFEDIAEFSCKNIYLLNHDNLKRLENYAKEKNLSNIENNLIEICDASKIEESQSFRSIFERHFQYIRNGILSLNDFSYNAIMNHIMNDLILSNISLFFDNVIIYIVEIVFANPYKEAIEGLTQKLKNLIIITEIIYFSFDIISILFVIFLYISGINSLCKQIFILREVFKIFEINE